MAKRASRWLSGLAASVAIAGVVGWGALQPRDEEVIASHAPISRPNLAPLMPYVAPVNEIAHATDSSTVSSALQRDPFGAVQVRDVDAVPAAAKRAASPEPRWSVSATLVTGTRRAAIINDLLVYVGDMIPGGGRLTAVEHDRVTLTDTKGVSRILMVKEGEG
jgi:hypothetical protein